MPNIGILLNGNGAGIGHFSLWRHFTTITRILQFFCFLMLIIAIVSLLSSGITKFEFEKENEMNSGSCSKMTPS